MCLQTPSIFTGINFCESIVHKYKFYEFSLKSIYHVHLCTSFQFLFHKNSQTLSKIPYMLNQTPRLLFTLFINLCGFYSRAAFISLSQSLRWRRREQSSIECLLDRQENLLVVADWFTSLFWVCFVSSRQVFTCARATQVCHAHCGYYSRAVFSSFSTHGGAATVREWLLIESGVWSSRYGM